MRELHCASTQTARPRTTPHAPPPTAGTPEAQPELLPVAAEKVAQPIWYTVVVCTSDEEGAGLTAADDGGAAPAVFVVLHGSRGSSQRVKLPSQAGDFERGQEDVFRWGQTNRRAKCQADRAWCASSSAARCPSQLLSASRVL